MGGGGGGDNEKWLSTAAFALESVNFNFGGHSTIFGHWLDALMGS